MINSYHIKMEDDSNHGNDETRGFILSTLAAQQIAKMSCVLCPDILMVYDRYPLINGTFFLSPIAYCKTAIPVSMDGRPQYLSAVCIACLESKRLRCLSCGARWRGSELILGTMYSYDVFAATPCCVDRVRCTRCRSPVLPPDHPPSPFSDYSRARPCPSCGLLDHHFVKPLCSVFTTGL